MNYIFSFKIHFWCIRIRKGSQIGFGTYFGGNRLDFFCTSQQIQIVSLGRVITQPWKDILHYTMTLQDMKTMKCGIDLILGIIPYLLQTEF
jgi:type 1 glutamine amidotransferase